MLTLYIVFNFLQDLLMIHSLVGSVFHIDFGVQDVHHGRVIIHVLYTCHLQRQRFSFCEVSDGRQQKVDCSDSPGKLGL